MTRTFLDAGILIAAVRGQEDIAARALAILEDPERQFISSDFLKMEVLPKALYYQRPAEVALYERFFSKARLIPVSATLVAQAYAEACTFGLSVLDALHITVAKTNGVAEFITTERQNMPLFRVTGLVIKTIALPSLAIPSTPTLRPGLFQRPPACLLPRPSKALRAYLALLMR